VRGTILPSRVAQLGADDRAGLLKAVHVDLRVTGVGVSRLASTRPQLNFAAGLEGEVRGQGHPRQLLPVSVSLDAPATNELILPARVLQHETRPVSRKLCNIDWPLGRALIGRLGRHVAAH